MLGGRSEGGGDSERGGVMVGVDRTMVVPWSPGPYPPYMAYDTSTKTVKDYDTGTYPTGSFAGSRISRNRFRGVCDDPVRRLARGGTMAQGLTVQTFKSRNAEPPAHVQHDTTIVSHHKNKMDVAIEALRQNARLVVREASHVSPFQEWTSDELRDLLVQRNIQVRDAANAERQTLVRLCDELFGNNFDVAASEKRTRRRRSPSFEDVAKMDAAARTIQGAFLRRRRETNRNGWDPHDQELSYADYDYDCEGTDYSVEEGEVRPPRSAPSAVAPARYFRHHSMLRRIKEHGDDYDEEIEVRWRKPSWKFAKRFQAASRPHRTGKRMETYDWRKVTLGRHCYAGGCGEQLDLWNEGRTSEFSQFGSGITNYFKVRASFLGRCVVSRSHSS